MQSDYSANPSWKHGGLVCRAIEPGKAAVAIDPILPQHRRAHDAHIVSGAMLSFLVDCAMAAACDSLEIDAPYRRNRFATVALTINYVRPVYGDVCIAHAEVTGGGKSVLHTRSEVRDAEDRLCAHASGAYRVWSPDPERPDGNPGQT
jgi:uncharacterized protein (TIGR00369 family)